MLPVHYDVVGQALLATLEAGLGAEWTAQVKAAWIAVYGVISTTMIGDNYPPAAAPAKSKNVHLAREEAKAAALAALLKEGEVEGDQWNWGTGRIADEGLDRIHSEANVAVLNNAHGDGGAFVGGEWVPLMSKTRWHRLQPAGAPELHLASELTPACPKPRPASASLGQSAAWAALAGDTIPALVLDTGGHRGCCVAVLDQGRIQQPRRLRRVPALPLPPHGRQARRLLRCDHHWRGLHRLGDREGALQDERVRADDRGGR